jgi:hypothetical protein
MGEREQDTGPTGPGSVSIDEPTQPALSGEDEDAFDRAADEDDDGADGGTSEDTSEDTSDDTSDDTSGDEQ